MNLSSATFDRLRAYAHQACGLALGDDKSYLVQHRLEPILRERGLTSFEEFCETLYAGRDHEARTLLIEALTTRETSFFRDGHPFETLRRHVLPAWGTTRSTAPRRIWSAGSSTGQEAYSLAMLVSEQGCEGGSSAFGPGPPPPVSVLATDICPSALKIARRGVYHPREVQRGLTAAQLSRWFEPDGRNWRVREPLRRLVEFRRQNLVEPFHGLGSFDLILCRNVLIYFDEPTRRRVCEWFYQLLVAGGWLLVGAAESLYGISGAFESIRLGDTLLYRKSGS